MTNLLNKKILLTSIILLLFNTAVLAQVPTPNNPILTIPQPQNTIGTYPQGIAISNIDGVGDKEILLGRNSNTLNAVDIFDSNGNLLRTILQPNPLSQNFGQSIANLGDINTDGTSEFAIGSDRQITIYSNSQIPPLYIIPAPPQATTPNLANFGYAILSPGDLNGDNINDLLVGTPLITTPQTTLPGRVYLYDGTNGALITTINDPDNVIGGFFGASLAKAGDVDQDGTLDYIVGNPLAYVSPQINNGRAYVFSGTTNTLLLTLETPGAFIGTELAGDFDYDQDNIPDILAQDPTTNTAHVFSGTNGAIITTITPTPTTPPLTARPIGIAVGDTNGNGNKELVIRDSILNTITTYTSQTGISVITWTAPNPNLQFGKKIILEDIDGDLIDEAIVVAERQPLGPQQGEVHIYKYGGIKTYGTDYTFQTTWNPNQNQPSTGTITITGLNPNEQAYYAFSTAPLNPAPILPGTSNNRLYIDPTQLIPAGVPQNQQILSTQADNNGRIIVNLNYNDPTLYGQRFYTQLFLTRGPNNYYTSQPIEIIPTL
jgi:hypothetical protein